MWWCRWAQRGESWKQLDVQLDPNQESTSLQIYALEAVPALVIVAVVSGYIQLMLNMMFIFPIVLIPSLYFLGRLVTKKEVMNGNQYKKYEKIAFWIAALIVVAGGIIGLLGLLPML